MVEEILIKDIKVLGNIRTELGDLSELMSSIRENGLLQPIGVWKENEEYIVCYGHRRLKAMEKLGRKSLVIGKEVIVYPNKIDSVDFLVLNITENLHRVDNTPIELAKACNLLKDTGLSPSEIASRLSIPASRVTSALKLLKLVPEEFHNDIGYFNENTNAPKKGKISATVANTLTSARIQSDIRDKLFRLIKKEDLTLGDVDIIIRTINRGATMEEAIAMKDKYAVIAPKLIINREEMELMSIKTSSLSKYVTSVLKGKQKPNKKLLF